MFKKWAKSRLGQFVPHTYEMRIKEKKCFTFVFAATISLFKSRLQTFLLSLLTVCNNTCFLLLFVCFVRFVLLAFYPNYISV